MLRKKWSCSDSRLVKRKPRSLLPLGVSTRSFLNVAANGGGSRGYADSIIGFKAPLYRNFRPIPTVLAVEILFLSWT